MKHVVIEIQNWCEVHDIKASKLTVHVGDGAQAERAKIAIREHFGKSKALTAIGKITDDGKIVIRDLEVEFVAG